MEVNMAKEDMNNIFDKDYPENAADIAHMGAVYAGPETFNGTLPPTPFMMMAYAGPNVNGIGIPNGFTIQNIGMVNAAAAGSPDNTANSKICPACGSIVRAEARFCTECGTQLVQKEN